MTYIGGKNQRETQVRARVTRGEKGGELIRAKLGIENIFRYYNDGYIADIESTFFFMTYGQ